MRTSLVIPAILTILVSSVLISSSMTTADAAIFMKIEGIEGEVTENGHEGWIEVDSFQFSASRAISETASGGRGTISVTSFSDIAITTALSKASPAIFTQAVLGDKGISVMIDFTKTTAGKADTFAKYLFTNTLISSYGISAVSGADSAPSETISLNFVKIDFSFIPFNADGTAGASIDATFDRSTGTGS